MSSARSRFLFVAGAVMAAGFVVWSRRRARARRLAARPPVTQATVVAQPADMPMGVPGHNLEQRLDEGLEESFPASDPVSVHIE
jgi:hypothetical protein